MNRHLLAFLLFLWPPACAAADFPALPPADAVEQALRAHPAVLAAGSGIAVN